MPLFFTNSDYPMPDNFSCRLHGDVIIIENKKNKREREGEKLDTLYVYRCIEYFKHRGQITRSVIVLHHIQRQYIHVL